MILLESDILKKCFPTAIFRFEIHSWYNNENERLIIKIILKSEFLKGQNRRQYFWNKSNRSNADASTMLKTPGARQDWYLYSV